MPIIINGGSYSDGGWWSKHLQKAETNERVEIIGFSHLSAETVPNAFREMQALAAGTRCKNYFYQANINPRADEHLTAAQRDEAVDRLERNLGLTGQPRFVVEHQKEGRTHWHVVWSRIDVERQRAISDSLTAAIHERTSRELEIRFDLERGRSVLTPNRDEQRERRPKKPETFRAADTGIDPETVKADARAARQQADNGQSFKAALEASGEYLLARGDRRDFVIIDRAGDDHSLGRRLGMKAAELRSYMADIDPANLPSVQEAKAAQQARDLAQEPRQQPKPTPAIENHPTAAAGPYSEIRAAQTESQFADQARRATEPAAPVWDRDAENMAWEAQLADAAQHSQKARKGERQAREVEKDRPAAEGKFAPLKTPEPAPEAKPERELSATAGQIRLAWTLSRTPGELEDALAAQGIGLARVSAEEAYASERRAALAKEAGNFAPLWREGEIVAVDGFGHVHRLTERTTGEKDAAQGGRFVIDGAALMDVAATQETMRAASLEMWKTERRAEREAVRLPSWIESRIAGCASDAPAAAVLDEQGRIIGTAEALGDRLKDEDAREFRAASVFGAEAFAVRLADAGIVLCRVTADDERALAGLRKEAALGATVAQTEGTTNTAGRRFDDVLPGELAAVTRDGDVYRINPAKLGDATRFVPEKLPGVIEARDQFATERRDIETHWDLKRAEIEAGRALWESDRQLGRGATIAERAVEAAIETPVAAAAEAVSTGLSFTGKLAKAFSTVFSMLSFGAMAEPKQTVQQMRDEAQARGNDENLHAEGFAAHVQAAATEHDDRTEAQKKAQQESDLRLARTLGILATQESTLNRSEDERPRDRDRDYERER